MLRVILFDLDNTLYPIEAGVMGLIGERITRFLTEKMSLAPEEAASLRREYVRRYGTTLRGLQTLHQVDPLEYLAFVHDVPIEACLKPDPALDRMLEQLAPEKDIFTNSTTEHARRVLRALGVERHFGHVFDIFYFNYENKPHQAAYRVVLDALGVGAPEVLLVEDSIQNIAPARALGMNTVLVGAALAGEVDFVIPTILDLPEVVDRLDGHA